jgi:transcriptional regulator with XRE-family HTH domain
MTPNSFRILRQASGLSQDEVAKRAHLTQPVYSLIETGKRSPDEDEEAFLESALALGTRRDFDEGPVYGLAHIGPSGELELLRDADGRLGIYRDRDNARLAEAILPQAGQFSGVLIAPAWLSHVALDVVRRKGAAASKEDIYIVDSAESESAVAVDAARHVVGVLATLSNVESYEEIAEQLARQLAIQRRFTPPPEDGG